MEKEAVKVSLSDEELNTISGGSVVTKQIVLDGKAALVSIGINASVGYLRWFAGHHPLIS